MARELIAVTIPDISQLAKVLRRRLAIDVGHQTMLNLIAQAAGFRNFQHLKSQHEEIEPLDKRAVKRALEWFDNRGRLIGWPGRYKIQTLCLWVVWSRLPDRRTLNEREISDLIDALCTFQDAAQIRRSLVDVRLLSRTPDGSEYRRIGRRPGPNELAVIAAVRQRVKSGASLQN
jgi:hypothetical protein